MIGVVSKDMRPAVLLALAALLGACGDDGYDPNSCKPDGFADVEGLVKNEALGPFVRAQQIPTNQPSGPGYAIVLDEVGGACGELASTGKHLVFLFCAPPAAAIYNIGSEQNFRCPTNDVLAIIEKDGGADFATATSGTLTILHAEGSCLDATYKATFGIDEISGAFDAVVCR